MKKDFAETLKEMRIRAGYSQKDVYERFDIRQSTFSAWETGRAEPSADMLLKLCKLYNVNDILGAFGFDGYNEDGSIQLNISEIDIIEKYRELDSHGKKMVDFTLYEEWERSTATHQPDAESTIHNTPMRLINYYYRLASAGTGQIIFDMPPTKRIEIPNIPEYRKADYAIGVNGNSMEPAFHDGDTLLIEMAEEIEAGEIGIFMVDNESYVKKLGERELISLNPEYDNIPLTENSKCMGRVIAKL